jgi:hypothetical protein
LREKGWWSWKREDGGVEKKKIRTLREKGSGGLRERIGKIERKDWRD